MLMGWQYLIKLLPAVFFLLSGLVIAADPVAKRRIIGLLANWGMANDDTPESLEASAGAVVKVFYGLALVCFLTFGILFYHHHRKLVVRPGTEGNALPYKTTRPSMPASGEPQTGAPGAATSGSDTSQPAPRGTAPARPYTTTRLPTPCSSLAAVPRFADPVRAAPA
jgi:hypothetical protein